MAEVSSGEPTCTWVWAPTFTPLTDQETMQEITALLFQRPSAQITPAPDYQNYACIIWKEGDSLLLAQVLSS